MSRTMSRPAASPTRRATSMDPATPQFGFRLISASILLVALGERSEHDGGPPPLVSEFLRLGPVLLGEPLLLATTILRSSSRRTAPVIDLDPKCFVDNVALKAFKEVSDGQ